MLVALCAAVLGFGLVGCASTDKPETASYKETQSELNAAGKKGIHKKHKKAKSKLGEEKLEKDITK